MGCGDRPRPAEIARTDGHLCIKAFTSAAPVGDKGQASPHAGRRRRGGRRGQGRLALYRGFAGRQDCAPQRGALPKLVPPGATAVGIPGRIILKGNRIVPLTDQCAKRQAMAEKSGLMPMRDARLRRSGGSGH